MFEVDSRPFNCLLDGSNVTITCNTEGFPFPDIIFLKDTVPIVPGVGDFASVVRTYTDQVCHFTLHVIIMYALFHSKILITNVTIRDEGVYTCVAQTGSEILQVTETALFCSKWSIFNPTQYKVSTMQPGVAMQQLF